MLQSKVFKMAKLKYIVPSRIAINLYDMNGNLGRVDGGMGFSLEYPRLVFTAEKADTVKLNNTQVIGEELSHAVERAFLVLQERHSLRGISIDFIEGIPAHSGFGSKTATLLSTGHALGNLYGITFDFRELASEVRRGGTSGLGVNLIDKGGFGLEGGHSTKKKKAFAPSSATKEIYPAPLLARYDMPDWDILLVEPYTTKMHGQNEVDFFNRICPIPEGDVERLARITLSEVLPAVVEKDLYQFCKGINAVQECYWKKKEIAIYNEEVREVMDRLLANGAIGAGMSSIGPTIYAFGEDMHRLAEIVYRKSPEDYRLVKVVKANNTGFKVNLIL